MMVYLLKTVLCLGALFAIYQFVLKPERSFKFNRFYLLAIVLVALIAPAVVTKTYFVEMTVSEIPVLEEFAETETVPAVFADKSGIKTSDILVVVYILVTTIFLFRFARQLLQISKLKKGMKIVRSEGLNIVLRPDVHNAFSFHNYMFVNQDEFEKGFVPNEIIAHERVHIEQRHSLDLILIELARCFFWFNPFVHLMKPAIKLNHEFLADEGVVKYLDSPIEYQKLIIRYANGVARVKPVFASHLSFGQTKTRINMMFKTTNKSIAALKQMAAIASVFFVFLLAGQQRAVAQEKASAPPVVTPENQHKYDIPPPPPPMIIHVNSDTKVRYTNTNGDRVVTEFGKLSEQLQSNLHQEKFHSEIMIPPMPPKKVTQEMMADFQNEKKYGVWLDGKKVKNKELVNLAPKDVHHYFRSKLHKNAKQYGQYEYQLNLITQSHFNGSPEAKDRWVPFDHSYKAFGKDKLKEKPKHKSKSKTKEK